MISQKHRFHGHNSLSYVYKNGASRRSQYANVKFCKNTRRKHTRVAVVVSKKVCKSAVGRNRIRRRVYEWVRPKISTMNDIYDIVYIVSSAELRTMPATELATILGELTKSVLAPTDKK
jgi:ribonuclease P protein component